MYLFQISNYDDPAVERETAELLHQRLEAESRRRCPAMWNAIDRIRTHAAKGPTREKRAVRCRIYGVFLLALGLLTLILGLTPPRITDVIIVGGRCSSFSSAQIVMPASSKRMVVLSFSQSTVRCSSSTFRASFLHDAGMRDDVLPRARANSSRPAAPAFGS